jgi:hypothetical protein
MRPVVSPNPFEDNGRKIALAPGTSKSILGVSLSLPTTTKKKCKSVNFCADPPQVFYALSVQSDSEPEAKDL